MSLMDEDSDNSFSSITCMVNFLTKNERKEVKIGVTTMAIDVAEIRQQLASIVNLHHSESINLMVFGQKMEDGKPLGSFELRRTSRIQAFINMKVEATTGQQDSKPTSTQIAEAKNALTKLRRHRKIVVEMMKNSDYCSEIVSRSEKLRQDYMAQVILKDPSTLMTMLKQANHEKIVDELFSRHPALIDAVILVLVKLPVPSARHVSATSTGDELSRTSFFLDRADDDDDDADDESVAGPSQMSQHNVTSTQLESALQSALSSANSRSSRPPGQTQTPASGNSANTAQPSNTQVPSRPTGAQTLPANPQSAMENLARQYESQLQQIENIGITDRALALQALYASNGDLQLALDIIYSSM